MISEESSGQFSDRKKQNRGVWNPSRQMVYVYLVSLPSNLAKFLVELDHVFIHFSPAPSLKLNSSLCWLDFINKQTEKNVLYVHKSIKMCFHRKFHCISGYKNWHFDPKHFVISCKLSKENDNSCIEVKPNNKYIFTIILSALNTFSFFVFIFFYSES